MESDLMKSDRKRPPRRNPERSGTSSGDGSRSVRSDDTSSAGDGELYTGVRGQAVKILSRVDRSDSYLDKLIDAALRTGEFDERDARLLNEITHGVLRNREQLDWVLTGFYHGEFPKCIPPIKNALRVALYQILFLDRIPHSAAVNESVNLVKRLRGNRSAGVVNGVLRNIIRRLDAITWPERDDVPVHYLSVMGSHPQWMVRRWIERYGAAETEELLRANNSRPPISINVDNPDLSYDDVRVQLGERGAKSERSPLLPEYLRLERLSDIGSLPMIREGKAFVQDEGAGLAARLTGVTPGCSVIDLCAAPGGKTLAMARMMKGEGSIRAYDRFPSKVDALVRTVEGAGLSEMISVRTADAATLETEPADVVLLDAPCSGLGVLRRKPEIRWKREPADITNLAELQRDLISAAARLVAPGGSLVYTTCTIEPEENEDIIEWFLSQNPDFRLRSADELLPDSALRQSVVDDRGYMKVFPHRHGTDGSFGAHLTRILPE